MPGILKDSDIVTKKLYPIIAQLLEKNYKQFKNMIADFMNKRHDGMYDIAPYDNIYYTVRGENSDKAKFFKGLGISEEEVLSIMKECFFYTDYWVKKGYNPQAAKEPYVMSLLCAMRYFMINKKMQDAELCCIYLAFSGKFYASCFGAVFPKAPPSKYKAVMDYVVNTMLNDKFSIKREGNMFGAVRAMCITWLDTYKPDIISGPSDDGYGKLLQQLKGRELSLLANIANLYYEAYDNKNYLNYESDSIIDDDVSAFRITENDANTAARLSQAAVLYMVNNTVNMRFCNAFSNDRNIRPLELKDIIESIVANKDYIPQIRRVVNILICDFMRKNKGVHPSDIEFMNYTLKEQPNTKDKYVIEMQSTILNWLEENSENYRRRKNRKDTVISYRKAIKFYLAMVVQYVAKNEV